MKSIFTAAMLCMAGAVASADEGGKLPWKRPDDKKFDEMFHQLKKNGKAFVLYFTSKGWGPCATLEKGAFSDDKVVAASGKLNLILVDCDWGKKHSDVSGKYGVRGYPTVIFVDSDGKEVAKLGGREADAVAKQFEDVAAQYSKAAAFVESWDDASAQAKEAGKTVVLFFSNGKADAEALEAAIGDDLLKDLQEKFVWCKVKLDSKSDLCKKFKVSGSSQSVLMVVDPSVEKPEDKPLKKWSGKKSAKELKKDLEAILKKLEDGK